MNYKDFFKGKKVTQLGLGLLGRSVGDAVFFAECGAELIVTDLKSREELAESVEKLLKYPNVTLVLGEHRLEDFRGRELVLYGPKVPLDSPYVAEARRSGARTTMSTAFFSTLTDLPIIGITGTRGKTTVTEMVHHILTHAGERPLLGGNIRGVSTLAQLPQVQQHTAAVLELDSWQLQGFRDEGISPHIAVFTTFLPDHQDYYQDMETYLADKAEIFLHQKAHDICILGEQVAPIVEASYPTHTTGHWHIVGEDQLPATWQLKIPGEHNRYNAALAAAASRAFGIADEQIKEALECFSGVPGRLERISEVEGVTYYNDTTATTPEATIAALRALQSDTQEIVLIVGGSDKGLPIEVLIEEMKRVKSLVLLSGSGTERLRAHFPHAPMCESMEEAFEAARRYADHGDAVLLSPAFASFGMFKNEYDRGDQFKELVLKL